MHMADALISPGVGSVMWLATIGTAAYAAKKLKVDSDHKKIPLMGIAGAFIFSAQMINFSIPGTGSSGHIGGGLLLAVILGPHAAFLTMASILFIQALFFGDGGLLALGCNIFNLGFFTSYIAYPFIFKKIVKNDLSGKRIIPASILGAAAALQLGAFSVVLQTLASQKTELPFITFLLFMLPIHLAIGIAEGMITAAASVFLSKERPEIIQNALSDSLLTGVSIKKVALITLVISLITAGFISWFASSHPDGLEWSVFKTTGTEELEPAHNLHSKLADIQKKTAFFPDYNFKSPSLQNSESPPASESWPAIDKGTSTSGIAGIILTILFTCLTGLIISIFKKKKPAFAPDNEH